MRCTLVSYFSRWISLVWPCASCAPGSSPRSLEQGLADNLMDHCSPSYLEAIYRSVDLIINLCANGFKTEPVSLLYRPQIHMMHSCMVICTRYWISVCSKCIRLPSCITLFVVYCQVHQEIKGFKRLLDWWRRVGSCLIGNQSIIQIRSP